MRSYYQRDVLERTTVLKGDKLRCGSEALVRGKKQRCTKVIAQVSDPKKPGGRHAVVCGRCGELHVI